MVPISVSIFYLIRIKSHFDVLLRITGFYSNLLEYGRSAVSLVLRTSPFFWRAITAINSGSEAKTTTTCNQLPTGKLSIIKWTIEFCTIVQRNDTIAITQSGDYESKREKEIDNKEKNQAKSQKNQRFLFHEVITS